ncbi:MarR family transcriptional repressor of emrRAB [Enterococcus sp. PF1-24]|uniref:MarR family winged helix-turn-helix transcriptional regulator n=1 Tax=unclassified Enterococcus TaxID=2608891 RepID=UPI0024745490|nr:MULTISPECIES: MarR family transcriptional regulator [unclassified Enterococcus]MDH6364309.1 MarR family transcriptional repressor of emrRAB [Enterococcus sp. PFB1-1]MDH6401332.1 MarR family transcriptional repressor of emrRAB [Enterococcus sp. PF1-24]
MDNFNFIDRPDNQRIELMNQAYAELNSQMVELFIDFQWTYRNMQKIYDTVLDKNDLSESRFIILMFLKQAPNRSLLPSVIADKLGATRATVSKLLKAMEAKNWLTKTASPDDKRSLSVQLTAEGLQVLDNFLPKNFQIVNTIFSDLSNEDIQQFSALLNKIGKGTKKGAQEMEQ